jgi:hypothetical protein
MTTKTDAPSLRPPIAQCRYCGQFHTCPRDPLVDAVVRAARETVRNEHPSYTRLLRDALAALDARNMELTK